MRFITTFRSTIDTIFSNHRVVARSLVAVEIGETAVDAVLPDIEFFMIDTHEMKDEDKEDSDDEKELGKASKK